MNLVEYLIIGFLVVMTIGAWVLINSVRHAEDAFENELGFQLGIASPVKSLDTFPAFVPAAQPRAAVPEITPAQSQRSTPGSKPPMLPANLTATDLNPQPSGKLRQAQPPGDSTPPISHEAHTAFPGNADTPSTE